MQNRALVILHPPKIFLGESSPGRVIRSPATVLSGGVMVAQLPLEEFVLVRIQAGQPTRSMRRARIFRLAWLGDAVPGAKELQPMPPSTSFFGHVLGFASAGT